MVKQRRSPYGFDVMDVGAKLKFEVGDRKNAINAARAYASRHGWALDIADGKMGSVIITRLSDDQRGNTYAGKIPTGKSWQHVGTVTADGLEWLIYEQPQPHDPNWHTIKIVASGRAKNKANYWLVRNMVTGQTGYARDFGIMRETRPGLYAQVVDTFFRINKNQS